MAVKEAKSLQIEVGGQLGLVEVVRQFPKGGKIYSGGISFFVNGLRPPGPPEFGRELTEDQMSDYLNKCQEFDILPFSYLTVSSLGDIFYPLRDLHDNGIIISRLQTPYPYASIKLWDQDKKQEFLLRLSKFLVSGGRFGQINYQFSPYGNGPYPGSAAFDSFRRLGYLDDTLEKGYNVDNLWLNFARYTGWNKSDGIPTRSFKGSLVYPAESEDRTKVGLVVADSAEEDIREELLNWYYSMTLRK